MTKTSTDTPRVTTSREMHALVRELYPAPEYAVLAEVRSRTGYSGAIRTADAMVMGLWPSRGLELQGCEIKVSRHDWKREKDDPAKAEEIQRFCHRWWIVAGSEALVRPEELPPTWGLLVPGPKRGGGTVLRVAVPAPLLTPQPPTYTFLAGLLRNGAEREAASVPREELDDRLAAERTARDDHWKERLAEQAEQDRKDLALAQDRIRLFEKHSGIAIDAAPDVTRLGEAVRLVLDGGLEIRRRELALLLARAEAATIDLRRHVGDIDRAAALAAHDALPFAVKLHDRAQGKTSGRPPEND